MICYRQKGTTSETIQTDARATSFRTTGCCGFMGVFRTHPEEDVKSFISNRRNESRFPERAEHCYTSGGSSRRAAAALIGFMSGDVYWSPSIECADLRGRGKRHENAVKKSPKKLGRKRGIWAETEEESKYPQPPPSLPRFPSSPTPLRRRWSILYLGQKLRAR